MLSVEHKDARICPGSEKPCDGDGCVMYVDGIGCRLAIVPRGYHPLPTTGKRCPFFREQERTCGDFCEMFVEGIGCAMSAAKVTRSRTRSRTEDMR